MLLDVCCSCCCLQPALRSGALDTIKRRKIVMNGPLKLVQGNFGTISRVPIFIDEVDANESFGNNQTSESLQLAGLLNPHAAAWLPTQRISLLPCGAVARVAVALCWPGVLVQTTQAISKRNFATAVVVSSHVCMTAKLPAFLPMNAHQMDQGLGWG